MSRSTRSAPPERGMTYRTRVPGSQSPRSSQRWGEPATGRRGTGGAPAQRERVRDRQLPDPSGCRPTGELLDIERVPSSSERGRRKSTCQGNSLAAYSIARPVWEGAVGFPCSQGAGRLPHRWVLRLARASRSDRRALQGRLWLSQTAPRSCLALCSWADSCRAGNPAARSEAAPPFWLGRPVTCRMHEDKDIPIPITREQATVPQRWTQTRSSNPG